MANKVVTTNLSTCHYDENGKYHREDGPAVIYYDTGREIWYRHGQLHRVGGPAEYVVGNYEIWYQNDLKHRDGGPAYTSTSPMGVEEWWRHGMLHREDGPACIYDNGVKVWHLNGCRVNVKKYLEMKNPAKSKYPALAMNIICTYVHDA